jgi:hypothetical protein
MRSTGPMIAQPICPHPASLIVLARKASVMSHKFGQECSRLPDGRGSVQTADSTEPRASASGGELFDEFPGHNTSITVLKKNISM